MLLMINVGGWIGAGLLLLAYVLISFSKLRAKSFHYQFLNALGSCLLTVNTVYHRAYPSASVNVIWIAIALVASVRAGKRRSSTAGS